MLSGGAADDLEFFFGGFTGEDFFDAGVLGHALGLVFAVASEEDDAGHFVFVVLGAEVTDEAGDVSAGLILETKQCSIAIVEQDNTFEAAGDGGEMVLNIDGDLAATCDDEVGAVDRSREAVAGGFAHVDSLRNSDGFAFGGFNDGVRQRMAGVLFETGDESKEFLAVEAVGGEEFGEAWAAVGEGPGLVEKDGRACINAFEDGGIADDDATPRGKRDGADDRDGNGNNERARRGNHKNGKETRGILADVPCKESNENGSRGVPGAQTIGKSAHAGTALLGITHDTHDRFIAGICRGTENLEFERRFTVDGAGEDFGARGFGDAVGFAGEEGFVHGAMSANDTSVGRTGFVRENSDDIAGMDFRERDMNERPVALDMPDGRHTFGESAQDRGGAADGVGFQSGAAGEHEHDDGAGEILVGAVVMDEEGRDDGEAREEVSPEVATKDAAEQIEPENPAADDEHNEQRNFVVER